MINKINDGIKKAMKEKDAFRLEVLRMMKSKIMMVNAKGEVDDKEAVKILKKYAKSVKETLDVSEKHGKTESAEKAKKELVIIGEFLPEEMSEDQVKAKVQAIIDGLDDAAKSNFGRVMGMCMKGIEGADGAVVKKVVNEIMNKKG